MIKIRHITACAILACTTLFTSNLLAASKTSATAIEPVDGIAAIVNKAVITNSQLNAATANVKKHMLEQNVLIPDETSLRKQVLKQLIMESLQLQMAKQAKVTVSSKELNQAINNIAKRNHISLKELKSKVASQGQTFKDFAKEIKKQMLISKIQHAAVDSKLKVTDADIDQFMQKEKAKHAGAHDYHIANILIELPDDATATQVANAKNRAEDTYKKLKKGESFAKVAKLESSGENALNGGDMGWQPQTDLPDLYLDQLKHMKVGQVTQPLKAGNGFHIIKLLGVKRSKGSLTRSQARQILLEKQFQKALSTWQQKLKSSAYIKVM
jgi:peptidyl-prolyl cis-trans isomerase SurA